MLTPNCGRALLTGLLTLTLAGAALPANAVDDKKTNRDQVRQLQQAKRTLEQDKAQLVQEKTVLDDQLKGAADKLLQTQHSADAAVRQRTTLAHELDAASNDKAALSEKLASLPAAPEPIAKDGRQELASRLQLQPDGTYFNPDGIEDEEFFRNLERIRSGRWDR